MQTIKIGRKKKMKKFESLGVMIDMSRDAVMSLDGLKRYLPLLAKMGYTTIFLYTEDTYEVEGEPYFGYMRGRYSTEEMKELDGLRKIIHQPCKEVLDCRLVAKRLRKLFEE